MAKLHKTPTKKRKSSPRATGFASSLPQLKAKFGSLGIRVEEPAFCDSPEFLAAERVSPSLLNDFATFVAKRSYDPDYLTRSHVIAAELSRLLSDALIANGREGACVDMSSILMCALHAEGVWCCGIKGSLTITYPDELSLDPRYFYSVDEGEFVAGHAWVYAPPFTVIDLTVRQQPYGPGQADHLPHIVLSTERKPVQAELSDIACPEIRLELRAMGRDEALCLRHTPCVPEIFAAFPATQHVAPSGARLKYVPVAIHAPDGTFESMRNMTFAGRTPWQLYQDVLAPTLRSRGL